MGPEEHEIALGAGRLYARRWNEASAAPPVVCIPGLSANARSFDRIAEALAAAGRQVLALDLRGRGRSEVTAPGTYGWDAHARDVLDAARSLGAERADLVGHSMGAYVAMQAAADQPDAVGRVVLVDGAGVPEPASLAPIGDGLRRLERWHDSAEAYLAPIAAAGVVEPWGPFWETFYRHELEEGADGRVRPRTSLAAVMEDVEYGRDHPQDELWPRLRGPVLLVRATVPLGDSGGFILAAADAERFVRTVPGAELVEVESNHCGVIEDDRTVAAITRFLT